MKTILLSVAAVSLFSAVQQGELYAEPTASGATEKAAPAPTPEAPQVGQVFPAFSETDLDGKPVSVANYKGKILLIDFWATWCGPCVAELPHVRKTYDAYHEKGFEVLGISLDRDKAKLTSFIAAKSIPWTQILDEQGKLAKTYAIQYIPSTFLIDKDGKIIASNLRGDALDEAVAKAVGAK